MAEKTLRPIQFYVDEKEFDLIQEKMAQMQIRNMSAYLRKMALDGYCVHLDLKGFREMTTLLKRCSNNLNQYARKANQSGSVYAKDIEDLRNLMKEIQKNEELILKDLQYIK